ncbi:MAG: 2,5-didehydrogluconate reductase [Gammaproteobacteria bacterium]|nr:2,5-didehydrogluconate reductase [Gammaproteobacteria bacterium]
MHSLSIKHQGIEVPAIGFGTFEVAPQDTVNAVTQALRIGYRHIDTAQIYGNEAEVGTAIQGSKINRNEIFLTTKIWIDYYQHNALIVSAKDSLRKLKTDYVDLLLLHWPNPNVPLEETIAALNEIHTLGLARHIGISNFNVSLMKQAVELSKAPIFMNQVEYHPYLNQGAVLAAAKENNILITAYSPLARGKIISDPVIAEIAAKHGKKPAQITLRWLFQQGVVAIPKTLNEERAKDNLNIFDFSLSAEEMARIHKLAHPQGRTIDPKGLAPIWD